MAAVERVVVVDEIPCVVVVNVVCVLAVVVVGVVWVVVKLGYVGVDMISLNMMNDIPNITTMATTDMIILLLAITFHQLLLFKNFFYNRFETLEAGKRWFKTLFYVKVLSSLRSNLKSSHL